MGNPSIGEVVAHYKILERLGGGGMGVVYKALDLHLDRPVALKFLPPELTRDPEAIQRFVQEARAASTLQHANICVVHDIDETSDRQMFIVMEHLEGETVRQKIERGPLPVAEAVDIAAQVAQGLQKAHAHGIVHRDIKPANIMVTTDGVAKIVDFGLAKLSGQIRLTRSGSTVGTIAYMSPEQAGGADPDCRTDLWSLGVMLYEMISGRLPFSGDHEAAVAYSILNTEPVQIRAVCPEVSAPLARLIDRALEKNREARYQSASEIGSELRQIQTHPARISDQRMESGTVASSRTVKYPLRRRRNVAALLAVSAILAGTVIWLVVFRTGHRPSALNPALKLRALNVPFTNIGSAAISSDGNWIVFPTLDEKGTWALHFMNSAGTDARPVFTDSAGFRIIDVDISSDGNWLAFSRLDPRTAGNVSVVHLLPVTGGAPMRVDTGFGVRWRPDGQRFGYIRHAPLAPSASGKRELWTASRDGRDLRLEFSDHAGLSGLGLVPFAWAPDGQRIAWGRLLSEGSQELFVRDMRTGREEQITRDGAAILDVWWARESDILFVSDRGGSMNIWNVPPSGGEPVRVTHAIHAQNGVRCSSTGNRLLFTQHETSWSLHAAPIGVAKPAALLFRDQKIGHFDPSPDGTEIAWESEEDGRKTILLSRRDGSGRREIVKSKTLVADVLWSPNGTWLAYVLFPAETFSNREFNPDAPEVYVADPHALAPPRNLTNGLVFGWTDPATVLVYRTGVLWLHPVNGSPPQRAFSDSAIALPVGSGEYRLLVSTRTPGAWIGRTDGKGHWRKIDLREKSDVWAFSQDNTSMTLLSESRRLYRVSFPEGRIRRLSAQLPDTSDARVGEFKISRNGREVFYSRQETRSRMILADSLFSHRNQ